MTRLRQFVFAGLLLCCIPAHAALNYQDMWWKPTESGWGLMVLHQQDTISAVMFHYRADRKPVWYLLSNATRGAGEVFTGSLIETEGPPLFGAYDPATLVTRPVGTMTITFSNSRAAVVDYTINGSTASRQIERITFANTLIAGEYLGSQSGYASCPGTPSIDTFTFGARITIGANSSVRVTLGNSLVGEPLECEWTGGFTQSGAIMTGSGTWVCKASGDQTRMTATWTVDELRIVDKAIVMNYRATSVYPTFNATCTERGVFSGVRR